MLFDGIQLVEGSELQNLVVDSGTSFPTPPVQGEMFYRTDAGNEGMYFYTGSEWLKIQDENSELGFDPVDSAGDTMTGPLVLSGDPTLPLHAATKQYVDAVEIDFTQVNNTPTSLLGYGILDAQSKDNDLTAIANLTTNGLIVRSGDGSATTRAITGIGGKIVVTNGNGVLGNPTIDLATVGVAGDYYKVTTDAYGRVSAGQTTLSVSEVNGAAPLASPALTGVPTAPTATAGTNTTQVATTAFVSQAVASGSAAGADKWTTPRNLSLTGDGTATLAGVDGTANVSAALTLATVNANTGTYGNAATAAIFTVNGKGLITSASQATIDIATSQVTSGMFADARIAQSNVTQHQAALTLATSQITSGTFADARIAQSNVTQHQAALTIAESQITNGALLARVADNETISGTWSFSNAVTGVDPTNATHLATKQYVDNLSTGLDFKASVRATTTANITLSGTQTVDGVSLVVGNRVLVKNQTNATENGIYVVAAGAWSRSTDADNTPGVEISAGMYCFVEEGSTNADSGWVLITDGPVTLGTTNLVFAQFTGLGQVTAGNGLTKTGSVISALSANTANIAVGAGGLDLATVTDNGTGNFKKIAVDSYGRVIGTTNVVTADIASLITTSNVTEGTNQYFTTARARSAISVTGNGLSYNSTSGVITSNATDANTASTIVYRDASGNFAANQITGFFIGSLSGNAQTATSWQTSRSIAMTGDGTWSVSTNGSSNVTSPFTLATVNSNVGTFGSATQFPVITTNGKGLVTAVSTQTLSTSNVAEGTNLYYLDSRARASISVTGSGLSYDSSTGVITGTAPTNAVLKTGDTMTGGLTMSGTAPVIYFDETDQAGANGKWRVVADGAQLRIDLNTAGARDFSTYTTSLTLGSVGVLGTLGTGIAAAGTTQGTATNLTKEINVVSSSTAGTALGVILPGNQQGARIIVINTSSNAINVYPPGAGQIDSLGASAAFTLPVNGKIMFIATSNTQYYTLNATYA